MMIIINSRNFYTQKTFDELSIKITNSHMKNFCKFFFFFDMFNQLILN